MKFRGLQASSMSTPSASSRAGRNSGPGTAVDTSAIMAPTAHNLTRSQVEAVAAYVSTLR